MGNKSTSVDRKYVLTSTQSSGNPVIDTVYNIHLSNYRTAGNNPRWKDIIRQGGNATNVLVAEKWKLWCTPSTVWVTENADPKNWVRTQIHTPKPTIVLSFDDSLVSSAQNGAAMLIRKKIQREASDFSGMTFLGELRESAHMIRHPAEALIKSLNEFASSHHPKKRRRKSKSLSDSWLEASFGWAPLLSDIATIAEASLKKYNEPGIKRVAAFSSAESSTSLPQEWLGGFYSSLAYTEETAYVAKVSYIAGIHRTVTRSNSGLERVVEKSRFNWADLAPTVWELMPWSFLADYFSNIGDVISAASMSMSNVAWSSHTVRKSIDSKLIPSGFLEKSSWWHISGGSYGLSRTLYTSVSRDTGDIPIPGIRFECPGRSGQLLNLAALLGSKFL